MVFVALRGLQLLAFIQLAFVWKSPQGICPFISLRVICSVCVSTCRRVLSHQCAEWTTTGKRRESCQAGLLSSAFGEELMVCFVPAGSDNGFVGKIAIPNHSGEVVQISEATHHQTLPSCQQGQQKLWKTIQGEQSLGNPSVLDYIFEQLHCLPFCVFLPLVTIEHTEQYLPASAESRVFNHASFPLIVKNQ